MIPVIFIFMLTGAGADPPRTVDDIFQFVSTALAGYYDDRVVANELDHTVLGERLTDEPIELLKRQGAGRSTLRALQGLRQSSATLPLPAHPVVDLSIPSDATEILHRVELYALGYVGSLPDFLCTSTTSFSESGAPSTRLADESAAVRWRPAQTIVEEVRYVDGADSYKTKLVNNKPDSRPIASIRATYTRGDFGSLLTKTFNEASQAGIRWDHWESIHGIRAAVFSYSVQRKHSRYLVCCMSSGNVFNSTLDPPRDPWNTAYRGYIYAAADTGAILRFTVRITDVPVTSTLREARYVYDYAQVPINQQKFWLVAHALHSVQAGAFRWQSVTAFSQYRKFGSDASITFQGEEGNK